MSLKLPLEIVTDSTTAAVIHDRDGDFVGMLFGLGDTNSEARADAKHLARICVAALTADAKEEEG